MDRVSAVCRDLLKSADVKKWNTALAKYPQALAARPETKKHQNKDLKSLDDWFRSQLVVDLEKRSPPKLFRPEVLKIVEWKLARGKFRPRLYKLVEENSEKLVEDVTEQAFRLVSKGNELSEVKTGITKLCELRGVGPATASAILSVYSSSVPFMADEAVVCFSSETSIKYTVPSLMKVVKKLWEVSDKVGMSPRDLSHCLWAEYHSFILEQDEERPLKKSKASE